MNNICDHLQFFHFQDYSKWVNNIHETTIYFLNMHLFINILKPICLFLFNRYITSIVFLLRESIFIDVDDSSFSSFVLSEFSSERQHCFLHYWAECEISAFSLACHPFAEVSFFLSSSEIWLRIILPLSTDTVKHFSCIYR